jgi:hypothetical protein
MKTRMYLGALLGITVVLFVAGMQATPLMGSESASDSGQVENATNHDSTGNWQTVLMGNGEKCEGLVFESVEGAEEAALKIGCSGYHEHHQEDGTVLYMPCDRKLTDAALTVEAIEAKIQDALVRGEITQEQADEKLAWLQAKNLA